MAKFIKLTNYDSSQTFYVNMDFIEYMDEVDEVIINGYGKQIHHTRMFLQNDREAQYPYRIKESINQILLMLK